MLKTIVSGITNFLSFCTRICNRFYSHWYSLQFYSCGFLFRIKRSSIIVAPQNITIGNNFSSAGTLYLYADEGAIIIGDNVAVNSNVFIGASAGKIVIGNNVLIAPNVVIRAADHGIKVSELIRAQPHAKGVVYIEDDVWIGSNAVITSNVTIAKGTVVGAGAVVTKSTEPYTIVGGVPARKISQRI